MARHAPSGSFDCAPVTQVSYRTQTRFAQDDKFEMARLGTCELVADGFN
jgi:hypothetical protein